MLLRELLEAPERVHQFFSGHHLDSEVRLAANPGETTVVVTAPEVQEGGQTNG